MEYYDKGRYAVDMRRYEPDGLAQKVLGLAKEFDEPMDLKPIKSFEQSQKNAEDRVYQAFGLLIDWIDSVRSSAS